MRTGKKKRKVRHPNQPIPVELPVKVPVKVGGAG
jgi:hypothetical protein